MLVITLEIWALDILKDVLRVWPFEKRNNINAVDEQVDSHISHFNKIDHFVHINIIHARTNLNVSSFKLIILSW